MVQRSSYESPEGTQCAFKNVWAIRIIYTWEINVKSVFGQCAVCTCKGIFSFPLFGAGIICIPIYVNLCQCQTWIRCLWFYHLSLLTFFFKAVSCKCFAHVKEMLHFDVLPLDRTAISTHRNCADLSFVYVSYKLVTNKILMTEYGVMSTPSPTTTKSKMTHCKKHSTPKTASDTH